MDRRQKKTRTAIFEAFISLLTEYSYSQITVGQILERADVARATFYAHFETKDYLLKELCGELFAHLFEPEAPSALFCCQAPASVFEHLFAHIGRNDNNILRLLRCRNNELFLGYFKENLRKIAQDQLSQFAHRKAPQLPEDFWVDHICDTFVQTLRWWISQDLRQTPEQITEYFFLAV